MRPLILLTLVSSGATVALPSVQPPPPVGGGDNGQMGGIFGTGTTIPESFSVISVSAPATPTPAPNATTSSGIWNIVSNAFSSLLSSFDISWIVPTGTEYPKGKITAADFYDPGTGPYPAKMYGELLANHTVYAPIKPPKGVKLATLLWGNGGCTNSGTPYGTFLTQVASYGYIAIANGPPGASPPSLTGGKNGILPKPDGTGQAFETLRAGFSTVKSMLDAQDWVIKGNADQFGDIDKDFFITAGSSCGGLEAYSTAYHNDKVKLIVPFNSGVIDAKKKFMLAEIKAPVVLITGGPKDVAYDHAATDVPALPAENVVINAELDSGHLGTFFAKNGGKYGDAAVALFDWVFRGDAKGKAKWTDPQSANSLVSQNWKITSRNTDKIKVKA